MTKETIGDRIRKVRKELKLTQQQIASNIGVSPTSLVFWERNETTPKGANLIALCKALGVEPGWLQTGKGEQVRTNFAQRLAISCEQAGIEEHGRGVILARKLGVTPKAVSKWLNAESLPRQNKVEEIAELLEVDLYWLHYGKEPSEPSQNLPTKEKVKLLSNMQPWDNSTPLSEDEVAITFLSDVKLSAENEFVCEHEQNNGFKLRFAKSTLRRYDIEPENAYCVAVQGNSMEPVLPDGSTVGINCGDKKLVDGRIYAINHSGELYIKKLYKLPGGGLRIYSFNEHEYPAKEYKMSEVEKEQITILGRVFWYSVML